MPVEQADEAGLRPRTLADFVGQRELKEHLTIVLEAARRRGQPADHLLLAGPPGLGKTSMAGIVANEMGVQLHITSGPALERAGDLAAILTKLGEGDVLVHRRDPPLVAGGRGDPLPGDGGLPARHRRRQGAGCVEHPADLAAVHPRRCDHPHGHDHRPVARPVRARRPARLLRRRRAAKRSCAAPPASSASTSTRRARGRSPAAAEARRASPTACCAGSATTPRCGATAASTRRPPARACACSGSTTVASTSSTGRSSPRSACSSAVGPSGCRRWRSASASSRRRSRTCTSRS